MSEVLQEVQRRAQTALVESPVFALRELRVEQSGDGLLLSGRVSSFYHKQLAQEAVRAVSPGMNLVNSVDVRPSSSS